MKRVLVPKATGTILPEMPLDQATLSPALRIQVSSDVQAVSQWLSEYQASPQTWRAYRKEAERLLLWAREQGLTLNQLHRESLAHFETFLGDPQPADRWIGPPRPRSHPEWRPFRRPLSASSRRQSLIILQGLFSWLVEAGWIEHNPFRLMRDKRRRLDNRREGVERYLERPLWEWLWQWLTQPLPDNASKRQRFDRERRRLLFGFAYLLAPRIDELARARMNDFEQREGQWWWRVEGKGGKLARIPVPQDMMILLGEWRRTLGLGNQPAFDEDQPLLRALDGRRGLSANQLYRLIKQAFDEAAKTLEAAGGGSASVERLRQATPHWLRHTAITHQAQAGVELRYLARTARHSRLDTTSQYLHAEADEWHRQLAAHRLSDN
jgi:integrase